MCALQLRELEADLEEERKQRSLASSAKKKLEGDIKDMQAQVEMANKVKEDALKQLKRLQAHVKGGPSLLNNLDKPETTA